MLSKPRALNQSHSTRHSVCTVPIPVSCEFLFAPPQLGFCVACARFVFNVFFVSCAFVLRRAAGVDTEADG